jgi:hypothetical protein
MTALMQWAWAVMLVALSVSILVAAYFVVGLIYLFGKTLIRLLTDR